MSINRINLPDLSVLEERLVSGGATEFWATYIKGRECFTGSTEAINFIHNFIDAQKHTK